MKLGDLDPAETASRLATGGLPLRIGPFVVNIRTPIPLLARGLQLLYADSPLDDAAEYADFHLGVQRPTSLRRWIRPQIFFDFDGISPFHPFPLEQALPLFEWGLNWVISQHAHQYLIIHAAVIEKDDRALIMPAPPGSGKSTLCAALASNGWRLLSDELTLLSLTDGCVIPLPRPIGLKNDAIDVMRKFSPNATIGPVTMDTHKGRVALMKPPTESLARQEEVAVPAWVVFPKYVTDAPATLTHHSRARACLELGKNAFNYSIHGANGFHLLTRILEHCDCYDFRYGKLSDAVDIFARLQPAS